MPHMSRYRNSIKVGQRISKGTIIGYVGSTAEAQDLIYILVYIKMARP